MNGASRGTSLLIYYARVEGGSFDSMFLLYKKCSCCCVSVCVESSEDHMSTASAKSFRAGGCLGAGLSAAAHLSPTTPHPYPWKRSPPSRR